MGNSSTVLELLTFLNGPRLPSVMSLSIGPTRPMVPILHIGTAMVSARCGRLSSPCASFLARTAKVGSRSRTAVHFFRGWIVSKLTNPVISSPMRIALYEPTLFVAWIASLTERAVS